MEIPPGHRVLEAARLRAQLSVEQLWLRYLALSGIADQIEVEAYLYGLMPLDAYQQDKLAHALNERLDELHQASRVPYTALLAAAPAGKNPLAVLEELLHAARRTRGEYSGEHGGDQPEK